MRCPECDGADNRVVDTRSSRGGRALRRRRECLQCSHRFTTYEFIEERRIQVLKQGGAVEEFDRNKLIHAVKTACAKRPVSMTAIEEIADRIEDSVGRQAGVEVPSSRIGSLVMDYLKPLDRVAYVRFASVYRNFQDVDEFQDFVDELLERNRLESQRQDQAELAL
jgi:transcriptional repressor NrdR